jgi:dihydrodipicolinate synthase/N-acetylneuraminate lyase
MMSGTEGNLQLALQHGNGAILVSGNLYTKATAAVFQAQREGKDVAAAYAKMREAMGVLRVQGVPGGAAQIKYALSGLGFRESFVRPPFIDLTSEQKAMLKPKLADLAKLT